MALRGPVDVTKMIEDELLEEEKRAHEAPTVPPVAPVNVEIDANALEVETAPATRPVPLPVREELLARSDPRREDDDGPHDRATPTQPPPPGYSPAESADDPKSKK
jgi:hypothetical protein